MKAKGYCYNKKQSRIINYGKEMGDYQVWKINFSLITL